MGKENSEKSTLKKDAPAKKTPTAKKKPATKKASDSLKMTSKTTQTPKAKTVAKTGAKKTVKTAKSKASAPKAKSASRKKKVSVKALLLKKFDGQEPTALFRPETPPKSPEDYTAPPFVSGDDEAEVARIRKLLLKKFDLSEPETGAVMSNSEPGVDDVAPPSPPPVTPPMMQKASDPMGTTIKFVLIGFALLVALVVKVSVTNRSNYYITPAKTGIDIWQGIFAPMGRERLISLENAAAPQTMQTVYSKQQIYPFIFNYYIKNADALLEKPGMPDFEGIKSYLNQAIPYAVTEKHSKLAIARLNNIDQMIFLIKADVAASKESIADYDAALDYLKQAQALDIDGSKSALINEKVAAVESAKAALEKEKAKEEEKAVEAAAPAK